MSKPKGRRNERELARNIVMKITLESTTKIVELRNEGDLYRTPARIWEGYTADGIKIHAYITRIACDENEPRLAEFQRDLKEHSAPSPEIEAIPLRLIL
jgi:hypothetical protein